MAALLYIVATPVFMVKPKELEERNSSFPNELATNMYQMQISRIRSALLSFACNATHRQCWLVFEHEFMRKDNDIGIYAMLSAVDFAVYIDR